MYSPSLKDFLKLSNKANVIPVYKEISADLDTPVSAFLKIKKDDYAFLLESVEGQEKIARYSFLGSNPSLIFKSKARNIQIIYPNTKKCNINIKTGRFITDTDPLDELKKIMQNFKVSHIKGLPRFYGGLVGYIGYDMVRFFEKLPDKNRDDLKLPDAIFILTDTLLAFDHINHTIKIISNVILPQTMKTRISKADKNKIYYNAIRKIDSIHEDLKKPLIEKKKKDKVLAGKIKIASNFKKSDFESIVNKAKTYIKNGDVIQVVLSQRFKLPFKREPLDIYRNLRSLNPSPYMFFLELGEVVLIGSSPEMLVRCEEGLVQARPIAGTRPRGQTEEQDRKLKEELANDEKEKAEHLMLVDLGRNDLGRVCNPGGVKVREFMSIEKYSHVMHLVSEINGSLKKGYDVYDCLRSCFPAGTVSGSPKIRAMEIIDELENIRRSLYAGCVGYFSFSNNMDTCI
ncbi:MAG: chorismate-binding protein, partial [Candidatus Omnitrophica bacterium]|nr:chorismate-binding protein [Candidatus Omnitrophota bacterium]